MANPGDTVHIETEKKVYEGILIQRPEILTPGYTVLKLHHGYNIGIKDDRIKGITVIDKAKPIKVKRKALEFKKDLPTISIISLGGTISSRVDYRTGGVVADYTAEDFVSMCPELEGLANIKAEKFMGVMSEDMLYVDWQRIARKVAEELNKGVDGVVLTQGTDTLHFTSAPM